MKEIIYMDTSALAKWYLNEKESEEVERYIQTHGPVDISELTIVELRSLLGKHRRMRHIDLKLEIKVFGAFQEDIRQNFLRCHSLPSGWAAGTVNLLSVLSDVSLKTLDALHLTIAKEIDAFFLATSDRIMAEGAKALGMSVVFF